MKKLTLLFALFISIAAFSQTTISGFVSEDWDGKQVDLMEVKDDSTKVLASANVDEKGFFKFNEELSKQPRFYYVKFHGQDIRSRQFFLQNEDDVFFTKTTPPFGNSLNRSSSDAEWTKLTKFKNKIRSKKKFLDEIRTYSKDSLQILAVKLVSIKELDQKQLLEKDIALNRSYYASLLDELKQSEIDPQEYLFLELRLTQLQMLSTQESYAMSKGLNLLLLLLLGGLLFYAFKYRKSGSKSVLLSKQEQTIKDLILEEKSNKEIASELFISVSTVKTHITSIYQKLQVSNRGDLIMRFKK